MMPDFLKKFETAVFCLLIVIVVAYISIEIIELFYQFCLALIIADEGSSRLLFTKEQTAQVLPVFFNILIAVELIDTFNVYIKKHNIKVQSILLIGLIAIGRKLLILDIGHNDGITNIGLASVVLALAVGYYLVKRPEVNNE